MESIESRFNTVNAWFQGIENFGYVIILLLVIGVIWDVLTRKSRQWTELAANFSIALVNNLLALTVYGSIFIIGLLLAEGYTIFSLPVNNVTWLASIILADFTYYWMHRCEHQIRFLWTFHSVHHSSIEFDLSTGFRLSWLESSVEWVFFVPMVLLGFDVVQVVLSISIVVAYQAWIHTKCIGKLGILDKIFNTPSIHRIHHATNPEYIDKNYGGILIIWDRIFGTYEPEIATVQYGLRQQIGSSNPITINLYEFASLFKAVRRTQGIYSKWKVLTMPPSWSVKSNILESDSRTKI